MKCRYAIWVIATLTAIAILESCSLKKNTAATRNYTAFITRYNVHYNGAEHFDETLKKMESEYSDDYSRQLYMHPVEAYADPNATKPSGSFDKSIEKAQKAIQLRSITRKPKRKRGHSRDPEYQKWMKRDEYNPFIHNSWLMLGRSQYFNGDFLGAASTFMYIAKHFDWLPGTVTEAKLWQALCYCALDWGFEAEMIITRIDEKSLTNNTLKGLYYFTLADYYIRTGNLQKATETLPEAIEYAKGAQKGRLWFLMGQLEMKNGRPGNALSAFKKAEKNLDSYQGRINARLMQSRVQNTSSADKEISSLKRMLRYERNKPYAGLIHHSLGWLYLKTGDTAQAVNQLVKAIDLSTESTEKAIASITLGEIYFNRSKYVLAQPYYSEGITSLPKEYPGYDTIQRRSDVLDELALYATNVELQDSLLKLADMTPEQQLAVVQQLIDNLKKQEKEAEETRKYDDSRNQQIPMAVDARGGGSSASAPVNYMRNDDKSWYFYNRTAIQSGRSEFQRRWGNRKLEDDWRRRNKNSFSFDEDESGDTEASGDATADKTGEKTTNADAEMHRSDPHYPEFYLKNIPADDVERTNSHNIIQEGLYNMGIILKDKLEDYAAATQKFDELMRRYPDNIYRLDAYYNLYLMHSIANEKDEAEHYRHLILTEFPDSKYGEAMTSPDYFDNLRNMTRIQEDMYEAAYQAYLDNDNQAVHDAYRNMRDAYPMSEIMPNFMFLDAMAYVTENNREQFSSTLDELLQKYPDTQFTPIVSSYVKQLKQGRELQSSNENIRGMVWQYQRLSTDSIADNIATDADRHMSVNLDSETPHLLILLYPTDSISGNQLIFDVASYNFTNFVVRDFDLEQMNFGSLGLLVIKGFANQKEVMTYRKSLEKSTELHLPPEVKPVIISDENFKTMLQEGRSFEEYFNALESANAEKTESDLISDADDNEDIMGRR